MIESPSASGYVKISVYASLATFAAIAALLWGITFSRSPEPKAHPIMNCFAKPNVSTAGWQTIQAGQVATLRIPPEMYLVKQLAPAGDSTSRWQSANGSLSLSVKVVRNSAPRWRDVRLIEESQDARETAGCPRDTVGGRPASIDISFWSRDDVDGYYDVYANVRSDSDRVVRIDVTSSDYADQQVGLAIVRSLRFVTAPPPT